ncbi:MAG: amino acid decarboxylase, partial [Eubacteriales bacterium]|nr:amino acid decarboxylase [Eubacteriales bacterium]
MNTPIADFVNQYEKQQTARLHMPGHKGRGALSFDKYDITEVAGADVLYEAYGIIAESEKNAAALFGSGRTCYSTEGSSQCIRAMLYLAEQHAVRMRHAAAGKEQN